MKKIRQLGQCILAFLLLSASCSKSPKTDTQELLSGGKYQATVSATALPGGRPYYTVSLMGGSFPNKWVRIAQYTFTAGSGSSGTVYESFRYYTQNQSGDHTTNKVLTGFTTSGCNYNCNVRTCINFQPGSYWQNLTGTYYIDVNGRLVITWSGGSVEAWTISSPKTYYKKLDIYNSNYGVLHGYGFGSNTGFDTGATTATIKAAGDLTDTKYWANNYQAADEFQSYSTTSHYLPLSQYTQCNTDVIKVTETGAACPTGDYKSYIAGDPAAEPYGHKRKNYRQFQRGDVGCHEGYSDCIRDSGTRGHIFLYLQVLDDSGVFRGFVGVEATLGLQVLGGRILSCFYEVKI